MSTRSTAVPCSTLGPGCLLSLSRVGAALLLVAPHSSVLCSLQCQHSSGQFALVTFLLITQQMNSSVAKVPPAVTCKGKKWQTLGERNAERKWRPG